MKGYDLIFMSCSGCKRRMKLSVAKDEKIRYTWCSICNKAVIWEAVNDELEMTDDGN